MLSVILYVSSLLSAGAMFVIWNDYFSGKRNREKKMDIFFIDKNIILSICSIIISIFSINLKLESPWSSVRANYAAIYLVTGVLLHILYLRITIKKRLYKAGYELMLVNRLNFNKK